MNRLIPALILLLALCACAPRTTVVLVPDDDGHVGLVDVNAATDKMTLKTADESVVVSNTISKPKIMAQAAIAKDFGRALAAAPAKPESFLLYFGSESAEPDQPSQKLIPVIASVIKARAVVRVAIIGHTDDPGDKPYNDRLSLARAESVRKRLIRAGVGPEAMNSQGFGPNAPLVPTAPGKHEAKNRRVEVFIR